VENTEENIKRGREAIDKVLDEKTDVYSAMNREIIGDIAFLYGEKGNAPYYNNGSGISHIEAKRTAEGLNGWEFLYQLVETIATGEIGDTYEYKGRPRRNIT
jgi:hypothetical protein